MLRGSQITGFTPVWKGDLELSDLLLQEAFQSPSDVSLYSILTVTARRMHKVSKITSGLDVPEVYAAKALKALRDVIESRSYFSSRLILDISYLVLSEVYVESPYGPDTYRSIIRDLIVRYGGLHKITPYTAQACLAWDNLVSATTLTPPALDPYQRPELLLPRSKGQSMEPSRLITEVFLRIQQLEDRPRIMATESHSFTKVIEALGNLPLSSREGIRNLVAGSGPKIFKLLTSPFLFTTNLPESPPDISGITTADGDFMHVKIQVYLMWVWYSALGFSTFDVSTTGAVHSIPYLIKQTTKLREQIRSILGILKNSKWDMPGGIFLWLLGVMALSAETSSEQNLSIHLLSTAVSDAKLETESDLDRMLEDYPSFVSMLHRAGKISLWGMITKYRLREGWHSTMSSFI